MGGGVQFNNVFYSLGMDKKNHEPMLGQKVIYKKTDFNFKDNLPVLLVLHCRPSFPFCLVCPVVLVVLECRSKRERDCLVIDFREIIKQIVLHW